MMRVTFFKEARRRGDDRQQGAMYSFWITSSARSNAVEPEPYQEELTPREAEESE